MTLWCVHVIGPDDVVPAPSEAAAREACERMNKYFIDLADGPKFEAIEWPHSAHSHQQDVDFFHIQFGGGVECGK